MNKDLIKLLIAEFQDYFAGVTLIERSIPIENTLNYVFVGLRRAGKSYFMYQIAQNLIKAGHKKDEVLYFNFEDDRLPFASLADLDLIKNCYEEMFDTKPIFFLDEIQIVAGWEKFARRLADRNYRVYITGSNAKMLSSEIATTLGGRFMIQNIYPFTFKESLKYQNIDIAEKNAAYRHKTEISRLFEVYFNYGGLPELINVTDKRSWLGNLYQKVFYGDLVARYQIRNDFALRTLIRKLAESLGQSVSFNRLANVVSASGKKVSTDTVIDYLSYLESSWLVFSIENIHSKLQDKISGRKYYFTDNGILHQFLIDPLSALLENQAAITLRRRFGGGVYFYCKNIEVDFYIPDAATAIQVSYSMSDPETRKREVNALVQFSKHFDIKECLIITKDEEETISTEQLNIRVLPLMKWLLAE